MLSYNFVKVKLSSNYLSFQEWVDRYGDILDIYWQESGCNLEQNADFEKWAKEFFRDCQRTDEYGRNE